MTDLVAPITEVTVYSDRALITRVGSLHLAAGEHELCIQNLPKFLPESLRAAGQGPRGTRILDVETRKTFHSFPPESELQTLETACDLLQQRVDVLRARQEALNDRRQWLRALGEHSREFAKGLANGQMKPEECASFFTFTSQQALEIAEAEQDLGVQIKQARKELEAKQRELANKQGYHLPDRLTAAVTVELAEEGDFALEISYLVTQASWYPQYDVRVSMDENGSRGKVELTYIGQVKQTTGEDWTQVNLALSTARPSQVTILPELQPQYLRVYTPAPVRPMMAMAAPSAPGGAAHFIGNKRSLQNDVSDRLLADEVPEAETAEIVTATTEQSGTAYVFKIARSVDIPSDNSPHKTTIARDDFSCEFDYVSAPLLDPAAHVRARVTNTSERVLLPGASSIFLNDEYVGTTQLKMTAPREQFKLFLGIDDALKITREQIEHTVEKGALLQGDLRRTTYAYRITLHNYAAFPRKLVLRDQLPVSQHEKIKVKTQTVQPQPQERTKLELLTWRFTLPADSEYKIEYRYTVEHPQDLQVVGLP